METRKHVHTEEFGISPEEMFGLLITPSAIRRWWGAARAIVLAEQGGIWAGAWGENEDKPDYISIFSIQEFEPPNRILLTDAKYVSKDGGLPFEGEMTTEFTIVENGSGCVLTVAQDGFPAEPSADDYYAACETGWRDTFKGIRKVAEE